MYSASEKLAIIRLVEDSELSIRRTLAEINVSRSSFYRWYRVYERDGYEGLDNCSRASSQHWNKISDSIRAQAVEIALEQAELTPNDVYQGHSDDILDQRAIMHGVAFRQADNTARHCPFSIAQMTME